MPPGEGTTMRDTADRVTRRTVLRTGGALALGAAACAGPPAQRGEPGDRAEPAKARAPVTLVVWENSRFKWRDDVGKAITDPLLAEHPWLTLDSSLPAGNAHEKFLAASAGGTPPDTYSSGSYWAQQ